MTTVYTVRGPNGEKYKVTGPDDATDDELIDQVQKYLTPKTGLSGSFQKGLEGLTSSARTAAGAAFGDPNVAAREALEREKTAAIRYPEQVSMEKVKEAYQRGLLPAAGEVLRQIPHAIAEQLPQLGTTLASGMAGARLGALAGPVGAVVGGLGGMAAPSLVQQLGGNIQRQAQEQTEAGKPVDINMLRAAGAAVPQAGLDILETRLLLGSKLFKGLTGKALGEVTKEQAEQLAKDGLLKTLAKGTVRGVVSEVPTEVTQQMLERWQAGLDLTSPEALAEYGATAYQTALLGPLGIPGQFAQRSQARDMVAPLQPDQTTQPGQPGQPPADQEKYVEPPPFVEKDTTAAVEAPAVSEETLKKKVDDLSLEELPGVIAHYEQRLATGEFKGEKHKANTEAKLAKVRTRLEELQAVPQEAAPEEIAEEEAAPEEIAEEEAAPEVTAPTPGVITENVLGSLGVKGQGSRKVKKALLGLDLNTQAGQETFDNLFQLPGLRFDQEAVTALRGTVENLVPVMAPAARPIPRQTKKQPAPKPAEGPQDGDNADRAATGEGAGVPVQGATATPGASPTELLGVGEPQPAAGGPAQVPAGGDVALRQEQAKAKADVEAAIQAQMNANAQALKNAEKEIKKRETRRLKDIGGKAKTALENEPEPKEKSKGDALLRRDGLMLLAKENITPRDYTLGVENLVDAKANDLLKLFGIPKKDIVAAKARLEATKTDALIEESFGDLASPLSRNLYNAHLDFLLDEPRKDKKEEIIQRLGKAGVSKQELAQAETRISKANLARQVAASKRDKTKKDLDQRQRGERREVARLQERYFDLQEEIAFAQDQVNELKVRGEPYQAEEDHVYSQKVALEEVKAQAKERGVTFPDSRSGIQYSRIMGEGRPSPTGNTAANVAKEVERILRPDSGAERITTVVQSVGQLPEAIRTAEGFSADVRGVTHRGRIWLVADNIEPKREMGVFLHEMGAHLGFDQVMSKEDRQFLSDQVRQWAKGDDLKGQAAKKALAKGGTNNDEIIAYAVEELVNRGVKPVGFRPESGWLRRVKAAFDAAMKALGLREDITPQQLVDMAFGAAHIAAKAPGKPQAVAPRFSTGSAALDAGVVRRNQDLTRQKDKPIFQQILDALASTKDRQRLIDKVDVAIADISGPVKRKLLDNGMPSAAMGLAFATKSTDVAATSMITGAIKLSRNTNQFTVVKGPSLRSVYDQVQEIAKAIGGKDNQKAFTDAMRVFDLGATVLRERSLPADQQGLVKFRPEDIAAGEEALRLYREQIRKGMDAWTAYKNGLLDAAQVAGRLSAEEVHELKKAADYVPWYRVLDDAQYGFDVKTSTKQYFRSLQDSGRIHELMGGSAVDRPVGNILDNMEKLSFWLVNASMKNYAATNVVDSLLTLGAEEIGSKDALKTPKGVPVEKSRVVQIYRNGEKKFYQLGDELDAAAFLPVQEITTPLMKFAGKAGNFLRKGVTYMPDFVVRQLFADAFRVTLYSGTKSPFKVGADTFAQYVREMKGDALSNRFAAYGIIGRTDYIFDDDKSRVRAELGPTQNGIRRATTLTFKMLDHMTRASDAAQRRAVYEQTLKDTGNEQLALYKAIEIINFQNRGRNQVVSTLRHVVPFVNAYIQGMSIALRSMTGRGVSIQEKKQALATFYATAAKITALSAVYAGLVSGDDEYEKMPDYEKAGSFLIPGTRKMIKEFTGVDPGGSLRIPVSMDPAGFLFKLLPEAGVDTFLKEAAGSDVDYTKVRRLLGTAFVQAISPPNVVPQAVKPTLEVWANKSFFTGNPIVGRGLQDRAREQQFTSTTSELGKILGQHLPLAPVQIDYLIRGYLGAAGGSFLWATSAVLDPIVPGRERPSSRLNEVPVIKSFLTGREPTGMKEDYYELREKAAEVGNTVNLMARRDPEAALEYARKNMDYLKIQRSGVLTEIDKMLGEIRKARDFVDSNKDMSADQKRDMLDQLEQAEVLVLTRMQLPMLRKLAGM